MPGIDDYRDLDVKSRIVVALEGIPAGSVVPSAARSNLSKARLARERGARGLLLIAAGSADQPMSLERIWVFRPASHLEGFLFARISPSAAGPVAWRANKPVPDSPPSALATSKPFLSPP